MYDAGRGLGRSHTVGSWVFKVFEGDPFALMILFLVVAVLAGCFAFKKYCDVKFGEYESWD